MMDSLSLSDSIRTIRVVVIQLVGRTKRIEINSNENFTIPSELVALVNRYAQLQRSA
jgi:hypothetical protein